MPNMSHPILAGLAVTCADDLKGASDHHHPGNSQGPHVAEGLHDADPVVRRFARGMGNGADRGGDTRCGGRADS